MQNLPEAFSSLAEYRQFILWKAVLLDNGKVTKKPVDYRTLDVFVKGSNYQTDPNAWTDFNTAKQLANMCGEEYGVGFMFTSDDPFYFLDIDNCLVDGDWSPLAKSLMGLLPGASVEISQSGTGLHIIAKGTAPEHSCKNTNLNIEFYTEQRFVALTGDSVIGNSGVDSTPQLTTLVTQYFPPKMGGTSTEWTTGPVPEWNGYEDDDKLIEKALVSKSAANRFGTGTSFRDLWERNIESLSATYQPDSSDDNGYDESSADAALAQHLAFWTGKDCERIKRLMQRSGLVRDKWNREDYINGTILRAVSMQDTVYTGRQSVAPVLTGELRTGFQFMDVTNQIKYFADCVYIVHQHKILIPNGTMLKPEQFNAKFGGYVFQLDPDANGKTTRKAWEVFTESQAYVFPKADETAFKPALPFGTIIEHQGKHLVNIYRDPQTRREQGDPTKFLIHLKKVLPVERDQRILLSYMAACIQYKGRKFQWCPLIQGAEGNGKSLFTTCLEFALGDAYTHRPPAHEVGEKHNDWLFDKLLICMEDVYYPEHKQEIIEILKPMITGERLSKRAMQQSQVMSSITANFILNSNYKNAVRTNVNNRRYAIFFSAQQLLMDILRDGMTDAYFNDLYSWLKGEGVYESFGPGYGYGIVHNYLHEYHIDAEFNPAGGCMRAPQTSSSEEVYEHSKGFVQLEIEEAVANGTLGFQGGWISAPHLRSLLKLIGAQRVGRTKMREIIEEMGYVTHPELPKGRTGMIIPIDGQRSVLYLKKDHLALQLRSGQDIVEAYMKAQQGSVQISVAASKFQ